MILSSAELFSKYFFSKNSTRITIRVANCLDPGQTNVMLGLILIQTVYKGHQATFRSKVKEMYLIENF